jgi:hypothetical protein
METVMNRSMLIAAATLALVAISHAAPVHADPARPGLHHGPARAFGAGTARAWVAVDMDGTPVSMGVSMSPAAMASTRLGMADVELPLPISAGLAANRRHQPQPAFRVHLDTKTREFVIVLDHLPQVREAKAPETVALR